MVIRSPSLGGFIVSLTVQRVEVVSIVSCISSLQTRTPLPFLLSLTSSSFLSHYILPVPSHPSAFHFLAPSSKVLRPSTRTASKFQACRSSHFPIYTPHLLYWLTWPLQWIPGTFLALRGKKWFAKCHFSCFCSSFQQRETWFSTKVNRALASLWTRST